MISTAAAARADDVLVFCVKHAWVVMFVAAVMRSLRLANGDRVSGFKFHYGFSLNLLQSHSPPNGSDKYDPVEFSIG